MITMGLGGLWHGASYNFLIWGLLHGVALVAERLLTTIGVVGAGSAGRSRVAVAVGWLVTFQFVSITWVFFRSPSIEASFAYFSTLLTGASWSTSMTPLAAIVFVLGASSHVIGPRWFLSLQLRYDGAPLFVKVLVPFAVIFLIAVAAPTGIAPFIYFQF